MPISAQEALSRHAVPIASRAGLARAKRKRLAARTVSRADLAKKLRKRLAARTVSLEKTVAKNVAMNLTAVMGVTAGATPNTK
jgi:hypothetical protein